MKNTKDLKAQLRGGESKIFLLASLRHNYNYRVWSLGSIWSVMLIICIGPSFHGAWHIIFKTESIPAMESISSTFKQLNP